MSVHYFEEKHLETNSELVNLHTATVSNEESELLRDTHDSLTLVAKVLGSIFWADDEIHRYLQVFVEESDIFESIYLIDDNYMVMHLAFSPSFHKKREDYFGLDLSTHVVFEKHHINIT